MENQPFPLKLLLAKARCSALDELSRQGHFGLKMAALATFSETFKRLSSLNSLPRVFHWTQTTDILALR